MAGLRKPFFLYHLCFLFGLTRGEGGFLKLELELELGAKTVGVQENKNGSVGFERISVGAPGRTRTSISHFHLTQLVHLT